MGSGDVLHLWEQFFHPPVTLLDDFRLFTVYLYDCDEPNLFYLYYQK